VRITYGHIFGPSVFAGGGGPINGMIFLDMLELFSFPPVDDLPNAVDIYHSWTEFHLTTAIC
jgi:hypothetical protein